MAVFMINICKYNGCGITFPRLADLIEHIEDVHIDYDPAVVEQNESSQPACIPLSYVLKFFTEASRKEFKNMPPAPDVRRRLLSVHKTPSYRSSTPTGSEMDDEDIMSPSEDSNDSWTTMEEYSSDYILRYGVKMNCSGRSSALGAAAQVKPFACPVPGCKKRYKNVNGIKYHSKNGHKKDGKIKKEYKCQCGKRYKTVASLKSHSLSQHFAGGGQASVPVAPKPSGLVAAAPRPYIGVDANKLVRIYDSIQTKDLPKFSIPKHSLSVNVVSSNARNTASLASSPGGGGQMARSPRVVHITANSTHDTNSN